MYLFCFILSWQSASGPVKQTAQMAGVVAVAAILLLNTDSMVSLAADTVRSVAEYGKLLLPVMTAALAAQGGITASAALYAGTAAFNAMLTGVLSNLLVPGIWVYLALRIGGCAAGEDLLRQFLTGQRFADDLVDPGHIFLHDLGKIVAEV